MTQGLYVTPTEFVAFADPRRPLMRTIASRERSPAGILGFTQWLPNPDVILKSLGRDISVYRELRAEPLVGSSIRRRK